MRKISYVLFSLALLILTNSSYAQNYTYRLITTKDGLPSSTITGITKDKNGVIWIGTEKGLCYICNGKIQQFKGLPDEGVLSLFASSDGSIWVGLGIDKFLVKIKDGKVISYTNEAKSKKNGLILSIFENEKHVYLAQNDGITVISPEGKFKPLINKIISDTMMSYWTIDFFSRNNKVYATSLLRGVNEVIIRKDDVVFKNIYKGDFLYGSTCSDNNLILTFDPEAKLFNADKFLSRKNQKPIKTLSARRPAIYTKDKDKNIFGGCYNMNYGAHGLIKINANFNEELLIPEVILGQEIFYDKVNNDIYFGTASGLLIINASLFSKSFHLKSKIDNNSFISSFPVSNGVVALTDEGLVQLNEKNEVVKKITVREMVNVAMKPKSDGLNYFRKHMLKEWKSKSISGIQLDYLKLVKNKWIVFSKFGFFIINKQFKIEDFIPIISTNFNYSAKGELLFDLDFISFMALEANSNKTIIYDCFHHEKFTFKKMKGIEVFGKKNILISRDQGAFLYDNKSLKKLKLERLNSSVFNCTSFQNKYLVISTVKGELLIYDSEQNFELIKTFEKSAFYDESLIDLTGNENYLVFITSKRIFIWDGNSLKSYNEYQNGIDLYRRVNINGKNLVIYGPNSILRLELPKLLKEIDKKIVFNVTNKFTKTNEPIFNKSNQFFAKKDAVYLQFLSFNELDFDVLQAFYRTNQNDWIEIDQNGKIYLQNLDFGDTKIEFKVTDKRSGEVTWKQAYIITNPAPWYFQFWAISLYVILFSSILILSTRFFIIKSKKKEIESLTFKNRLNELQMEALQSQMNPHFVFNALNSVQKFILNIDQEKALLFLNQFSVLIRKVLDFSSLKSITIEEEIAFLNLYLTIENQRFQDCIKVEKVINCDDELSIPPLLIQPLIENAIIYGYRSEKGEMLIFFSITQEDKTLRIEVKNEMNLNITKNHTFQSKSTEIIQKRLALYDTNAVLKTTIEGSFFIATILLPVNE